MVSCGYYGLGVLDIFRPLMVSCGYYGLGVLDIFRPINFRGLMILMTEDLVDSSKAGKSSNWAKNIFDFGKK